MSKRVTEAEGFRMTYESYGKGYPGYFESIERIADGAVLYAGPYVEGEPQRHPDWIALDGAERARIRSALHMAPPLARRAS